MQVRLYNIQGFRGDFTYEINDLITIINSKHNGVGKTTLFDCIRFLCDTSQVDKEEHQFFLNLNEEESLFSITKDGVTHGFVLMRGKPPLFFRQVEGEELERSSENFPSASQDIGILHINDTLLNIFSKEVNLFSSSNSGQNYQLVKEITTHQQTEQMLELLARSIEVNQSELNNLRAEKKGVDLQLESMPYFFCIEELETLLSNTMYEEFEIYATSMLDILSKLKEVEELNFNSEVEHLVRVKESIDLIQASDYNIPDPNSLELLEDVHDTLSRVQPSDYISLDITPLEYLEDVMNSLDKLVAGDFEINLNTQPIEMITSVLGSINSFEVHHEIDVSSSLPTKLSNICIKLGEMITACNQEERYTRLLDENRKRLASTRVQCPIRQEVYLVNGKCVYE